VEHGPGEPDDALPSPPPAPVTGSSDADAPIVVERGARYSLVVSEDAYEIWDARDPDDPVARFTGDEAGMDAAVRELERLEHPGRDRRSMVVRVLSVLFGLAIVLWVAFDVLGAIELRRQSNPSAVFAGQDPADTYERLQLYTTISSVALSLWIASFATLAFAWLAQRVEQPSPR
jgi:hypothetical protein